MITVRQDQSTPGSIGPDWGSWRSTSDFVEASCLEKLEVHLRLSFSRWETHRLEGSVGVMLCQPWGCAQCGQNVATLLLCLSGSGRVLGLHSPLGSGDFFQCAWPVDSCIVGLVEGTEVGDDLCCPLDVISL